MLIRFKGHAVITCVWEFKLIPGLVQVATLSIEWRSFTVFLVGQMVCLLLDRIWLLNILGHPL